MSEEWLRTYNGKDRELIEDLASDITERFNNGVNCLNLIKVSINPKRRRANIYAVYEDTSRLR